MSESEPKKVKLEELQRVCLIVIDGWGVSEVKEGNAVFNAKTPVMDHFEQEYPVCATRSILGNTDIFWFDRLLQDLIVFFFIFFFVHFSHDDVISTRRLMRTACQSGCLMASWVTVKWDISILGQAGSSTRFGKEKRKRFDLHLVNNHFFYAGTGHCQD